jgi:hypothetical protein
MKASAGFARYQEAMANLAADYLRPAWEAKQRGEVLARETDSIFSDVFYGFIEISNALDALSLIETLVKLSAPRSKKIKKDEYLKFLIGGYLQEVYILEQRLTSYAKRMGRAYRVPGKFEHFAKSIHEAFKGVVDTRSSHVHSARYTDKSLDTLSTMSLISTVKSEYKDDLHLDYWLAQSGWLKRIKTNNQATKTFMDWYFDALYKHMSQGDLVVLPSHKAAPRGARRTRA